MWIADSWKDYEVLDTSSGDKLERWGKHVLIRPDPQIVWNTEKLHPFWEKPSAKYTRSSSGGGSWDIKDFTPFEISYKDLVFKIKPMNFKHTGLFPEQAVNWDWAREKIRKTNQKISVLNLFAYTGGASVACAKEGAEVTHVDASKGMIGWSKENAAACGISNIRYIVDDCIKFVNREIRRGKKYDALIMDPPSYGRGPDGEVWKLENELYGLLSLCLDVLAEKPLFFILNSYTTGLSAACMNYMLSSTVKKRFGGFVNAEELALPVTISGLFLPCGATARWSYEKD